MLYSADESFSIKETLVPDRAQAQLERLLPWYWEGVPRPLLVLPKASYAYALKLHQGGRADPINAALSGWNGNSYQNIPGDKDDPYGQLVLRGVTGAPLEGVGDRGGGAAVCRKRGYPLRSSAVGLTE
jgi:exonuclease V gamma subunit